MDAGAGPWIAFAALMLSAAIAFGGYRNTRVSMFKEHIEALKGDNTRLTEELEEVQSDLRRERRERQWIMEKIGQNGKNGKT